mmetsp:Transcript_54095/g.61200  ORF Transcript_54095/g.61200 Transcript_54095/m.61200 type:complete len:87 (-) Transcript_54095:266-526(-)
MLLTFFRFVSVLLHNSRSIGMRNEIIQGQMTLKRMYRIIVVDRDDPFIVVPIRTIQQDILNEQIGDRPHDNDTDDTQGQTHHETHE